jgi:phosphatidylglycerol lysyltransferase
MSLGLAPFSGLDKRGTNSPAARAMRLLYRHGSFLFRYKGLREFKEKFRPQWEPRYLVYSSELQLPGIALAVARAGELRGGAPYHSADEDDELNCGVVQVGALPR